jgi:tRNA threonylcarbamoyladenosine biosynthesis protein TsaB
MKLLALDTSTDACSAALALDGEVIERFEIEPRHGERILVMVDQLLKQANIPLGRLDAIAFGRGPGSFTSLRIGAGVVQGLAFGADLPVVPVSSLAALAQGVDASRVIAAFDARMQQVYYGVYFKESGLAVPGDVEGVFDPANAPIPQGDGWIGAGSGWDAYHGILRVHAGARLDSWIPNRRPHARDVATLAVAEFRAGKAVDAEHATPVYIRDDVAVKASKR